MELTYTKVGDYYIPDLALENDTEYEIGIYGRMRQRFLEEHHHGTYTSLLLTGNLWKHLADIDAACHERMVFLFLAINRRVVALGCGHSLCYIYPTEGLATISKVRAAKIAPQACFHPSFSNENSGKMQPTLL